MLVVWPYIRLRFRARPCTPTDRHRRQHDTHIHTHTHTHTHTSGMDDYITKPVQRQKLHEMIAKWTGRCPKAEPETRNRTT